MRRSGVPAREYHDHDERGIYRVRPSSGECRVRQQLKLVSSEPTVDLYSDCPPKMEPLPASGATRLLLLQNGQLICPDLTMLIAQTLNHVQHAHTVRDRLHFGQFQILLTLAPFLCSRVYFRSRRNYNIRQDGGLGPFPNSFFQTELVTHLQRRPESSLP